MASTTTRPRASTPTRRSWRNSGPWTSSTRTSVAEVDKGVRWVSDPCAKSHTAVAILLVLAAAVTLGAQPRRSPPTLYEGARIITGTGAAPIEDGAFVVQDGTITAIGPRGLAVPPGTTRIELSGKTVMPGLVNAH